MSFILWAIGGASVGVMAFLGLAVIADLQPGPLARWAAAAFISTGIAWALILQRF